MMRRLKALAVICAAACALTAVSASAAQAGELYVGGSTFTGTTGLPSAGGPFTLESKIGKTPIVITCSKQAATFSVHNGTDPTGATGMTGTGSVSFTECTSPSEPKCAVPNITTKNITIHTKVVGGKEFLIFRPTGGIEVMAVVIEGCVFEGTFSVTGQTAGYDSTAATESAAHTLQFSGPLSTEAGTELKFNGTKATLFGSSVETMSPSFSVR